MVGFIYKYENKLNHKVYIGQTTDLVNRANSHKYRATFEKTKFYNAVRKYGWENFEFDILAQVEEASLELLTSTLDALEIKFIEEYDSFIKGYNSTTGGHCYRGKEITEEFREYCRNRTYSDETRRKMSEAASKRVISEETRSKFRERALKNNFAQYREITTEKRNAGIRRAKAKKVLQFDKEGNIVNSFETIQDAALCIIANYAPDRALMGIWKGLYRHFYGKTKKRYYYGFEWKLETHV